MEVESPSKFTLPTIFVIFGITGDLVQKKILKAIYDLYIKNLLPERFRIYGFSRRDYDDEKLKNYLRSIMQEKNFKQSDRYEEFLEHFFYIKGDFYEKVVYDQLANVLGRADGSWRVCSNKLFYLAVPPKAYSDIIDNLALSGLTEPCSPEEGWTRVILEKPFGNNLDTAMELDRQLGRLFKEEQIYRVDHYLAKETVRNILAFRFSNSFLTPVWNKEYIEKIEVRLMERATIRSRGEFYDSVGALRDVGQNHMLQLLSLFIMDYPLSLNPNEIKKKRSHALSSLSILNSNQVEEQTMRGQYDGYKKVKGVDPYSGTETYFKMKIFSMLPDFEGVPIYLESGKAQDLNCIEVMITFKQPRHPLFELEKDEKNILHYHLKPDEKISMKFLTKMPGFTYELEQRELSINLKEAFEDTEFIDDYEALLYDIIRGDQTLFVSTEEIFSQWRFIEPIVNPWHTGSPPLFNYPTHRHAEPYSDKKLT